MKTLTVSAALLTAMAFVGGAYAQQAPTPSQTQPTNQQCTGARADAPKKIEGTVTKVDPQTGTVTVRTHDGKQQEFKGSKETISEYKVGDQLEANLRAGNC
jgi:Cu/Ag efflux protein CusF